MNDSESILVDTRPDIGTIFKSAIENGMEYPDDWYYIYSTKKYDYFKNKFDGIIEKYPIKEDRSSINRICVERDR